MALSLSKMPDAQLLAWAANAAAQLSSGYASFGLTSEQSVRFQTLNTQWSAAMSTWHTAETRTPIALGVKNMARAALVAYAKFIVSVVNANPDTTASQREALQIDARKKSTVVGPTNQRPMLEIASVVNRTITLKISNGKLRSMPEDMVATQVFWFAGENAPADPLSWNYAGSATRKSFDIMLPDSVAAGTQLFICATYVNARQQAGPLSLPITTNVQGGAATPMVMKMAA